MKRNEWREAQSYRDARRLERAALRDDAASLGPVLAQMARKHRCAPSTIAKIAVEAAR